MTKAGLRPLGVGHRLMPWGAHLLVLHNSDLALDMTLIRYLEAGLIAGEACLWITASAEPAERVRRAADSIASPLIHFLDTVLTVVSFEAWHFIDGRLDSDAVAERWKEFVAAARRNGFVGARALVETGWSTERHRDDFVAHDCARARIPESLPVLMTCAYAHGSISGEPLRQLRRAHDAIVTLSEAPTTFNLAPAI